MLSNQMPEIPFTPATGDLQRFEALAYCIMASYSGEAVAPRVLLSFQHAFDVATVTQVPRVVGATPGYTIASYVGKPQPKMIIAIEPTTDRRQIIDLWGTNARVAVASNPGLVFSPFAVHANSIFTQLQANSSFVAARNTPGLPIIFTGFSLGAAIAECLAERFGAIYQTKPIKCIKFASPRVGNAPWVANRQRNVFRDAVYFERDPIDLFPFSTVGVPGLASMTPVPPAAQWVNSTEGKRLSIEPHRTPLPTHPEDGLGASAAATLALSRPMNQFNPWFDHDPWRYYLAFMMNDWGNRNWNLAARMLFLEFNNRNYFGQGWLGESIATAVMTTMRVPDPDPFVQFFREDEITAMTQALGNAGNDPRYLDPRHARTTPGGVATQRRSEPVIPAVRDITATPPPIFVYPATGRRRR